MPPKPQFFPSPSAWRIWLEENHASARELWVGFYKRDSGKLSITWPESVDGALCFGWIDGVRKSIDAVSYKIRFTPRKRRSVWSAINVKRVAELSKLGLMHPSGLTAFETREGNRTEIYSYEQRKTVKLPAAYEKEIRKNQAAWQFFESQPPWYQRTSAWWAISAKKEETRQKRLATLIEYSAKGKPIPPLARPGKS